MPSNVISEVVVNGNTYGIAASDAVPNLATVEPDATSASKAYTVGEHVVVDDIYYKVIDDIETGDAFIVNTNIEVAKVGDEIERINQHLTAQDDTSFQFRVDGEGNYGYLKGDGTFSPFSLGVKLIAYGCNGGTSYSMNKNFVDTDYINRTITSESHILEFITDCKGLFDVLNANTVNWGNVGHTQITNHIGTYNYNFYNFEAHTGDIITITTGSSVGAWNGYDVFV